MPDLGWQELIIILIIVVIIFGAGKLPEIGSAAGKSIKEFKNATEGGSAAVAANAADSQIAPQPQQQSVPTVRADEI